MIILFLFQIAKLENTMSTCFGKITFAQKRRRLTCGAQSIANLAQGPEEQNPRDRNMMNIRTKMLRHRGPGEREGYSPK
jgi:hypothetical protein